MIVYTESQILFFFQTMYRGYHCKTCLSFENRHRYSSQKFKTTNIHIYRKNLILKTIEKSLMKKYLERSNLHKSDHNFHSNEGIFLGGGVIPEQQFSEEGVTPRVIFVLNFDGRGRGKVKFLLK